jgi:hypothetical protein
MHRCEWLSFGLSTLLATGMAGARDANLAPTKHTMSTHFRERLDKVGVGIHTFVGRDRL